MTAENIYGYASVMIFIPWLLMMFAPNKRFTEPIALLSAVILLVTGTFFTWRYFQNGGETGSVFSFDGMRNFFRDKEMLVTIWLNYLSICLFVGVWQNRDSATNKIPHIWVLPCLALTLLTGPIGLIVYLLIRWVKTKK